MLEISFRAASGVEMMLPMYTYYLLASVISSLRPKGSFSSAVLPSSDFEPLCAARPALEAPMASPSPAVGRGRRRGATQSMSTPHSDTVLVTRVTQRWYKPIRSTAGDRNLIRCHTEVTTQSMEPFSQPQRSVGLIENDSMILEPQQASIHRPIP